MAARTAAPRPIHTPEAQAAAAGADECRHCGAWGDEPFVDRCPNRTDGGPCEGLRQ